MQRSSDPSPPTDERALRAALSRREFLKGAGGVAASGVIGAHVDPVGASEREGAQDEDAVESFSGLVPVTLQVNGAPLELSVEPRTTLLSALRCHAEPALTGSKLVCDRGNCGACTVLLDGEPVYSCLVLALSAVGRQVRTVEGLAQGGELSPVQAAMLRRDALMCGFCTPGFTVALTACLERDPAADLDAIRTACSGNFCRCGTYTHLFEAGLEAGAGMRGGGR